jgi:hypothetical protein
VQCRCRFFNDSAPAKPLNMTQRQKNITLAAAVVVLIACLIVIGFVLRGLKAPPPTPPALSEADARQLVTNKNLALGRLENHDTVASIPIFEEIAARLPGDPLGPRNLAVARLLALGEDYERVTPERIEAAHAALSLVEKTEGQSKEWHWLSARAGVAAGDLAAAQQHLLQVIAADKSSASAWYELFLVRQAANPAQTRGPALMALEQALQLRPENLYLLVEYLRRLEEDAQEHQHQIASLPADKRTAAQRRAIAEHGGLADRLRQARETLAPFQDRIRAISGADVVQLMDEALAAVAAGDVGQLADRAGQVARVTLGAAAADRNQIRRHVLEFVLFNFRPEFAEQQALLEPEAPPIKVSFAALAEQQFDEELLHDLSDVRAVELADFNLDGRPDLIVLDARGIHVFARAADAAPWRQIATSVAAAGATGLFLADLDLDFDETPVEASQVPSPESQVEDKGQSTQDGLQEPKQPPPSDAEIARACPSADVDCVAFGPQGVAVLRNQYSATTRERSLEPIAQPVDQQKGATAATAADLDGDGDLDLVVAAGAGLSFWSNRGNGTFDDISLRSSRPPPGAQITGLVAADWDRDVDVDILATGAVAGTLENMRHGQLRWRPFGDDFPSLKAARALEIVDADANASWDLLAAAANGVQLERTTTPQPGVVRPLAAARISDRAAQNLHVLDFDNDGLQDFVAWDDSSLAMYRGLFGGRYQPVDLIQAPAGVRDCRSGDLDGDGDLDLVLATAETINVFVNQGGNENRWLNIALVARQTKGNETSASGRVNAHGVGSLLELKTGNHYQPAIVRGQSTHFGLGHQSTADVVRVVWLNGVPQNIIQPAAERAVCEQQLLTGSCPYLYTWNGSRFEFVTDLLWASPLGLQAADGVLLPWREWEYLKVPGEKLAARDGEYVLQLTEELWEAAYVDQVKLIAVDHPDDVDIYSNEKVGPAEIAQFKIHTARVKRRPTAAHNHRGRDLLTELAAEDGAFAKPFDKKLRQGLVEEHYIELDLGDLGSVGNAQSVPAAARDVPEEANGVALSTRPTERHGVRSLQSESNASPDARRVILFLTGWIYPSGTSLNVAISQNSELQKPKPPSLLVPDGAGGWREASAYMGFPGGKTKTIAIDLTGLLRQDDHRLRIVTNMELYWDHIFFTVDEPAVELRQYELDLTGANLHYRGFSKIVHDTANGPERFLYDQVITSARWPPMQGRFTRFGDVAGLVHQRDDRMVVFGAGDELTLRFRAPSHNPRPGWKRDFVLYNVGWDKDANLCTVAGQTVEPLPFAHMRNYPPSANDRSPDSAEYRHYLRGYQTREQLPAFWRAVHQNGTPSQ